MATTKEHLDGLVYARTEFPSGGFELLKADPRLAPAAPLEPVAPGHVVTVTLALRDFDGEARADSMPLVLLIGGQPVDLLLDAGQVTLEIELHEAATVRLSPDQPPAIDMVMVPFTLEVTG